MKQVLISDIIIGKRFRKEIGDLKPLEKSITKLNCLLHPIVVEELNNGKFKLVAGKRRILACKNLGWNKIPINPIKISLTQIGELHENGARKNFTGSEIVAISEYIEKNRIGHRPKKGADSSPFSKGKTRDLVQEITGISHNTLTKLKEINNAAKKEPEKYKHILEKVDRGSLSPNSAHKIVTREKRNLRKEPLPKEICDVFYCDHPIAFDDTPPRGGAANHYMVIPAKELIEDMKTLSSAKNAVIFFWMSPSIAYDEIPIQYSNPDQDGCAVIVQTPIYKSILDAGGFKVKAEFTWKKHRIGMGSYNRNQHENIFFAIKGKMPTPAKLFSSFIEALRKDHSEKPKLHKMIEEMYPKRNYCEIYGRDKVKGWIVHGNQIKKKESKTKTPKNNMAI